MIENENELAYYQVGKVYRNQNIISANIGDEEKNPNEPSKYNVCFHIYSIGGKSVSQFLIPGSAIMKATINTIIFPSGSEFLVCKREQVLDVTHIYIREVTLGLSRNAVMWIDESALMDKMNNVYKFMSTAIHDDEAETHTSYVIKSSSITARSYFNSVFFKASLHIADSFKLA